MFRLEIKKGSGAPEGANRMSRTTRTDVATRPRFGRGARHGQSKPSASGALASRRSTAALAVVSRPRLFDFRPGFLGRGSVRALPALACPSPAAAPRAPAVIPADMMPEAARERFARPPAGTALAPLSGSHLESALVERDGGAVSRDGDGRQARSTKQFAVGAQASEIEMLLLLKFFCREAPPRQFQPTIDCALQRFANAA
jgi:hypothetical protein